MEEKRKKKMVLLSMLLWIGASIIVAAHLGSSYMLIREYLCTAGACLVGFVPWEGLIIALICKWGSETGSLCGHSQPGK